MAINMQKQICIILLMILYVEVSEATDGVCYRSKLTSNSYVTYYYTTYARSYYVSCGWWSWGRCLRYQTKYRSHQKNHPAVYSFDAFCCSGYSGNGTNCQPVCGNKCVHGYCSSPSVCTCDSDWTGSVCRDDSNLVNWCTSLTNNYINIEYNNKVRSSLDIYCDDSSPITYNATESNELAMEIHTDSQRLTHEYRPTLYQFWREHPSIRKYCCYSESTTNYHQTVITNILKFDDNFYSHVTPLTNNNAIELRKELDRLCSNSLTDTFCPIYAALDIITNASSLPSTKSQWTDEDEAYSKAVLIRGLILSKNYPTLYPSSIITISESELLIDCTNTILKYIQDKEVSKLKTFVSCLPPSETYKAYTTHCKTDDLCTFLKIAKQAQMYVKEAELYEHPVKLNGKKRLILNTGTDYREFLRQKQLDRILVVLAEQHSTSLQIANELKKHATTKFTELRTYFEKVETFNQNIAEADIASIDGRISHYQKEIAKTVTELKGQLKSIIIQVTNAAGLNVIEKSVILALDIADAFNPLKFIFGGGSVKDVIDSAAAVSNAISGVTKMARVAVAFGQIQTEGAKIGESLEKNDKFLRNVKNIIYRNEISSDEFEKSKNTFIEEYNAYDPQVTLPEITKVTALWQNLIDAACDVAGDIDSTAGSIAKSVLYGQGLCESAPALAEQMGILYEEIYEYQFDLMHAMAAYVRSSVALDAASEIKTELKGVTRLNLEESTTVHRLAVLGGLSYVTYQAHIMQIINLYCNILEYMEGGILPPECKGVKTDLYLLIANIEPVCVSETYRYYYVPTKNSSDTDKAYINMEQLFSGGSVHFEIPNSQWLIDHDWIQEEEKDYAFYVKQFHIFLPVKTNVPTYFYITADPVLHNSVIPGSTEYIITPHVQMTHEYSMGPSRLNCRDPKTENPYTSCEDEDINEICHFSKMTKWPLYPSIYSHWSLSIHAGGKNLPVPNPSTDMSIILGIQMCKVSTNNYPARVERVKLQEFLSSQCCSDEHYRPNISSACVPCPEESFSALSGYYCEKRNSTNYY